MCSEALIRDYSAVTQTLPSETGVLQTNLRVIQDQIERRVDIIVVNNQAKMEINMCALFVLLAVTTAYAFPAANDKTDEVEYIPLGGRRSHVPYFPVDVERDAGYFPFGGFDDFSSSLEAMMTKMRNQLAEVLRHLPTGSSAGGHGINFPDIPNIGNVDMNKGNTTSVTKIIDGHKVVINETEYNNANEHGGAFFKVRIIDIKPDDEHTTEKDHPMTTPENREVEAIEDSIENEIPKTKETSNYDFDYNYDNLEAFGPLKERPLWNDVEPFDTLDGNNIDGQQRFHDLSNDIYVNDILAQAGAPTNPDAEYIEGFKKESRRFPRRMH